MKAIVNLDRKGSITHQVPLVHTINMWSNDGKIFKALWRRGVGNVYDDA